MRRAARPLARRLTRGAAPLAAFAALACGGAAAGQSRAVVTPSYQAVLEGAEPTAGLGATIPVRILDARDLTPAVGARVSGARLVSPFGVVTRLPPPPEGAAAPGVRLFRGDLLAAGPWTLEFTVAEPGRGPATTAVAFNVGASAPPSFVSDPTGASIAATDPSGGAGGPAIAAPGPGAASATPAAPVQAVRAAGYSPGAAPFCATCAAEAPH